MSKALIFDPVRLPETCRALRQEARAFLADRGYDPAYGARPLKRAVQKYVQDPLAEQIRHFCAVVRGEAQPLVSGREGLASLKVIMAIKEAAATGRMVEL